MTIHKLDGHRWVEPGCDAVVFAPFPHPARQTGRALLTHPPSVRDRYAFALDTSAIRVGNGWGPSFQAFGYRRYP